MREKSKLKSKYKKLVREGKIDKAQKVLEEVWALCGIYKTKKPKSEMKKVNIKKKANSKEKKKYSQKDLEEFSFKELKVIGRKFGTTDRSKKRLIKEILSLQ